MTQVKIYSPDGKEAEVDTRNAAEMVQHNGWRYKIKADPQATKVAELEAIETTLKHTVKVYKEDGQVFDLNRANARELLSVGGYSLKSYTLENSPVEDAVEEDAVEEDAVEEDAVEEDAVEEDAVVADVLNDTLASIAQAAGFDAMDEYLDSLNESPLRDLALLRYEEKIHHRASKANTIVKIMELEEAALEASKF